MNGRVHTLIESLGVYLPPRQVSTDEVLRGCRKKVFFPLQRLTGIESRHVAGDTEFAIDLAKQAIARCLAVSRHTPGDVELLISTCIARVDSPGFLVSYEPSAAVRLKHHFGFERALVFDLRSACAGMFAAINIVDALIQRGVIACGLVVSGEYITHLTATAQLEIEHPLDARLACLTLGDAGAAVLLEAAPAPDLGFAALDLRTLGEYARYCIAEPTEREHGGAIMLTEPLKLTEAAARHGSEHALRTLEQAGWSFDDFDHLIMHQTSRTALTGATRAINRRMKRPVCHEGNTIDNLAQRGNTATTTHMVALADGIGSGRIRTGDRVIFAVNGSGLTIGTALYTLDDLPDRLRGATTTPRPSHHPSTAPRTRAAGSGVRITGVGTAPPARGNRGRESLPTLEHAARNCLASCGRQRDEIDLLIYAGTYRTRFIAEPAMAALLAGQMGMNVASASSPAGRTLAFDVFNGAVGVLNACYVAAHMIRAGKAAVAMVVMAETENNAADFPNDLLGIEEAGSALVLEAATGAEGFGTFLFRSFPEHSDSFVSYLTNRDGKPYLRFARDAEIESHYVCAVGDTLRDLLQREQMEPGRLARIFPPQLSSRFIEALSSALDLPSELFVNAVGDGRDLFTSSVPFALRKAWDHQLVRAGDVGLIVTAGSGMQVGCALYYF